jgi:DNA-binding NarL/FixJ family response regulator
LPFPDPTRHARHAERGRPKTERVLLIDPAGRFAERLLASRAAAPQVEIVGCAFRADHGLGLALIHAPDVIVLGWGEWGQALLHAIRRARPAHHAPRMILVAETWPQDSLQEWRFGAGTRLLTTAEAPARFFAEIETAPALAAGGSPP